MEGWTGVLIWVAIMVISVITTVNKNAKQKRERGAAPPPPPVQRPAARPVVPGGPAMPSTARQDGRENPPVFPRPGAPASGQGMPSSGEPAARPIGNPRPMTHPAQPMTHIPAPPPVSPRPVDATVADPPSTSSGRFAQAAREDEYIFGADGRGKAAAWAADGKTAMGQAQTEGGISGGTQDGEILLEEAANSAEHEALVKMISDFDLDKAVVYSEILKPRFEEAY